jgi:GMP synthase (glutamine-hydrolysing)
MKPVFILRNVSHETAGSLESYLAEVGMEVRCLDLFRETPRHLPLQEAAALVGMGGPMSVHDVDQNLFLAAEVNWIRQAVEQRLPTLGICLGSQLLAHAMGAKVYPNRVKEIGWYPLEILPAAADDPLFADCDSTETVFQWHGDTFDLPPGAVLLAQTAMCKHQAYRVGPCAWGLQFHVEMTPDMVDCWLSEPSNREELAQLDYIDSAAMRAATPCEFPKMERFGRCVLSRFAALCARHEQGR